MPLMKGPSKKAFKKNVETEMEAGKSQPQSLAIAYSTQKHNKKKMALGGAVESATHSKPYSRNSGTPAPKADDTRIPDSESMAEQWSKGSAPARKPDDQRPPKDQYMASHFAEGGEVHPKDFMTDEERAGSIAEAIMRKRKMMADGGMVDLEANSEESPNMADEYNYDANGKEQYDDSQISPQPEDSNEHGDSREDSESDKHDMVKQIRSKLKSSRGF